jgi:uncharacterized protein YndB with AHSA1/START domain
MVDITTEIVIDRPPTLVAAFAADPANAPQWYENIKAVAWDSEPVVDLGGRATFEARFLGRTLRYTYEIVDFVPGERLTMRTAQGPFPMETTYTWQLEAGQRTRMTLRNRGEPAGFSRLVAPVMAPAMRRANRKDLAGLKRVLER